MSDKIRRNGGMILIGRSTGFAVAMPFYWLQTRHYRAWDQTQAFMMRGRQLTNDQRPCTLKPSIV